MAEFTREQRADAMRETERIPNAGREADMEQTSDVKREPEAERIPNVEEEPEAEGASAGKRKQETEENTSLGKEIFSWVKVIGISMLVALILRNYVIVNAKVPSGSMENTIATGDRLLGFRTAYWFSEPKRGDVVIFYYPVHEAKGIKTKYIKRIIGMPGETVTIRDAKVYIDGELLEEDYLKEEWTYKNDGYTFVVPEGAYFVMGDNRNHSDDARVWAQRAIEEGVATDDNAMEFSYVKREAIIAKASFSYWPLRDVRKL